MNFELTELEAKRYRKFDKHHQEKCQKYTGAIGENCVHIIIKPSSIGRWVGVICTECGKEEDITDLDMI
jgi:hypothetical protein